MKRTQRKIQRDSKPSSREVFTTIALKREVCRKSKSFTKFSGTRVSLSYLKQFSKTYDAIALDFDGTLVSLLSRTSMPSPTLIRTLGTFLNNDVPLVVISGRGDSLMGLSTALSEFNRDSLFLAMYNGSRIVRGPNCLVLADKRCNMGKLFSLLSENRKLSTFAKKWTLKDYSIQAIPKKKSEEYIDSFCAAVRSFLPRTMIVKNSGYALDVYPVDRTKDRCLHEISRLIGQTFCYLRIGDQGHRLGNDYELLNSVGGFSVGTLSIDQRFCFPVVSSKGERLFGPSGAEYLLSKIFQLV